MRNVFEIFTNYLNEDFNKYVKEWFEEDKHKWRLCEEDGEGLLYAVEKYNEETSEFEDTGRQILFDEKRMYFEFDMSDRGTILDIYKYIFRKDSLMDCILELTKKYKLEDLLFGTDTDSDADTILEKETKEDINIKKILSQVDNYTEGKASLFLSDIFKIHQDRCYGYICEENMVFLVNLIYSIKDNKLDKNTIVGIRTERFGDVYKNEKYKKYGYKEEDRVVKWLYFSNADKKGIITFDCSEERDEKKFI